MTKPLHDDQLEADFRGLRETETRAAPDYRQSLADPNRAMPNRRFRPAMQFAMVAAILVVAITVFLNTGRDQSMPETAKTAPPAQDEMNMVAALEMPTDFLLNTPWFELARTTPDFDFDFPHYDIMEDLSDEI